MSGGNPDLVTYCDLGDPLVQKAINHYLDNCHVLVVILQPDCRTVGLPLYVNYEQNHHIKHMAFINSTGSFNTYQLEKSGNQIE